MDVNATSETPEIKLHFLDYWRVIRLRRSLILTVFLLCLISSTLLTYWLPKQYSSTVQIEVQKDAPEVPLMESRQVFQTFDPYFLTTQFQIIKSFSILSNVIAKMEPPLNHVLAAQLGEPDWSIDETFDYLQRRIGVDQTRGTSLIEISVRNPSPALARDIANAVAYTYKDYRENQWRYTRTNGIAKMQEQVATNMVELGKKQTNLDELRITLHIPETDDNNPWNTQTTLGKTLEMLEMKRLEAQLDYDEYNKILTKLNKLRKENEENFKNALASAYAHQLDPELTILFEKLNNAKEMVHNMSVNYGDKLPLYQTALADLTNCQKAYDYKIEGIMTGLNQHVEEAKEMMDLISNRVEEISSSNNVLYASYTPYIQEKQEIADLHRTIAALNQRIFDEQIEAGQPLQNNVFVHNPARLDKRPVSPKSMIIIPLGVLVGLMVGIGLAFFIEYLDTSVKTIDDVERSLQSPVLGVIPQNVGNIMEDGPESPHAEAYRVLRTNLLFTRKDDGWKTLSVLSGGAGEGKTTTLFNLATVFAQNGQRILVVDSDLRRPSIHKLLKVSNSNGLTDLLMKQKAVDQVIQKTKLATFDFLPSGKLPSSSLSILSSNVMKELIQELKRRYEFVFFDSPPLLGVSDASILASEMDMTLQVIQYRRYPQPMTLRAKQMILKVGGRLMGLVLNNINMSQDENYYYYSGYYDYEYRSQQKDSTVVQLSEAAKASGVDIKQKY